MTCEDIQILPATPAESSGILQLLSRVSLPHEGVAENLHHFLVAKDTESNVVGTIGLEYHGTAGLLRSAAIAPECQGSGMGSCLTTAILDRAKNERIEKVVLLTNTAKDFFAQRFGFDECSRSDHDETLAGSEEWNLPRCSTAVCMSLDLNRSR